MKEKECLHEFVFGYIAGCILYCKKCDKEVEEIYDNETSLALWDKYLEKAGNND